MAEATLITPEVNRHSVAIAQRAAPAYEDCRYFGRNSRARYNKKVRVWNKTGGHCRYCGDRLHFHIDFEMDHRVPRIQGGSNALENLEPSCVACNREKHGRTPEEWGVYVG